jgi:hypothetical protein
MIAKEIFKKLLKSNTLLTKETWEKFLQQAETIQEFWEKFLQQAETIQEFWEKFLQQAETIQEFWEKALQQAETIQEFWEKALQQAINDNKPFTKEPLWKIIRESIASLSKADLTNSSPNLTPKIKFIDFVKSNKELSEKFKEFLKEDKITQITINFDSLKKLRNQTPTPTNKLNK